MRVLQDKDYRLFEKLVSLNEKQMVQAMTQLIKSKYDNVIATKDYIIAIGDIPIALVAHMDTVFKFPVSDLYYDQKKGVLWSPEGLGADDRAGIFAIIKILQDGLRPSIILTTGEEEGGVGACAICEKYPECDFSSWDMPTGEKCPVCGDMVMRKKGQSLLVCRNAKCSYKADAPAEADEQ